MKEPILIRKRGSKKPRRPLPPVPGGKALARLHQFEAERSLDKIADGRSARKAALSASRRTRRARTTTDGVLGEHYLKAFRLLERVEGAAPAIPVPQAWRPLGPHAIPHGQTYGSGSGSRPSVSGRVSAIAVDPSDASHLLIGAAGGGVWESRDEGKTWQPRTDGQPSLAMGAIAFAPSNPLIAYAGTGEGNFFSRLGAGLLRSDDGGASWTVRATIPFVGGGFFSIAVDPADEAHVLAGTVFGLYESSNGGTTWTQRRTQRTWKISFHAPGASGSPEVLAACADGVFRSTNGGTSWTSVSLPGAPASWTRIDLDHAPSDGNVAYVFGCGTTGTAFAWRRNVLGGAFSAITLPTIATNQAWYDWFAAVAPNNPDLLYLGAIEVFQGVRSASNTWSWTTISARATGDSIHPDQHAIAFSPTDANVVYIGNDGGVYRSPNAGVSWSSLNKGLCITEFEYLAQHPQFDAWLLGGTQDNGTLRYEGEEVWYHVQDGDGGDCGVNASTPYTCFHTFYGMGVERSTSGGGWGSWTWIGPNPPTTHQSLFYPPLETNGSLIAQAGTSVFLSTDSGNTWTSVSLPAGIASALTAPSGSRVYAATTAGDVYRIELLAGVWQAPVALTRPRAGVVSDLLVDPTNANRIWATYSTVSGGHVFRSDDGGITWTDVSGSLLITPVNAIELDPANTATAWVAADVGVYRTTDSGVTWAPFNTGLPNALVKDLLLHPPTRLLRAATQSRGVWEINVDQAQMPDVQLYIRDSAVDTGRRTPSPSGVNSPFEQGINTYWWECTDIKVDAPSYQTPGLSDVDFERFEDDHGIFAAGLNHESAQRGRNARVYVQVHNRGTATATNVAVRLFFADASAGLPDLPAGFWVNFPNNVLPAASPWQPIGPHVLVPSVATGRGEVVGFDWSVPSSAADHTCLLAIISAANDPIGTTELSVGTLVPNNVKCGLKNLAVVNPPPIVGPAIRTLVLRIWPTRERRKFVLGGDRGLSGIVSGVVLPRNLAALAKEAGLKPLKLSREQQSELERLAVRRPELKSLLVRPAVFVLPRKERWFNAFELVGPESIVLLIDPKVRGRTGSIIQWAEDGAIVGGFTLQAVE